MINTAMHRLIDFIVADGNLRPWFDNTLIAISFALMIAPWFTDLPFWLIYALFCMGAVFGAISAYSGRFGLRSFTNDPLGWRKAKESYVKKNAEEELKPSVDSSVEDSMK
jgi:hypothetical protein